MGREIKFRVWDGKQWSYFTIGQTMTSFMESVYDDHCLNGRLFLQYTGLKDKTGKEIYEGDIIAIETIQGIKAGWAVEWHSGYGCFGLSDINFGGKPHPTQMGFWRTHAVIGSIYENPELLNP